MIVDLLMAGILGQASPQGPAFQAERLVGVPVERVERIVRSPAQRIITESRSVEVPIEQPKRRCSIQLDLPWIEVRGGLPRLGLVRKPVYEERVETVLVPAPSDPIPLDELRAPAPQKSLPPLPQRNPAPSKATPQSDPDRLAEALERIERRLDRLESQGREPSEERSTIPPPPAIPGKPAWSSASKPSEDDDE